MGPTTSSTLLTQDQEHAMVVLDTLARSKKKMSAYVPGTLQVAKLLKLRNRIDRNATPSELICSAKPASKSSHVRWVHFHFYDHGTQVPKPQLVEDLERILLYYPTDQFDSIYAQLRSRKDQFCYFWQAADASQVKAWLFQPA
ncbi:MAG: hypothetical protein WAR83_02815 [Flavobacteriales bacterium]|nr:hypothetical protein [Flavobacteriales bacterium]